MKILRHLSPLRAYHDLRLFLSHRRPHQWAFLALAVTLTGLWIWAFVHDSHFERPYRREIIYVQDWRLDRTDEEIRAQQKIDEAKRQKEQAELEARRARIQAEFKKLDDGMTAWGL